MKRFVASAAMALSLSTAALAGPVGGDKTSTSECMGNSAAWNLDASDGGDSASKQAATPVEDKAIILDDWGWRWGDYVAETNQWCRRSH